MKVYDFIESKIKVLNETILNETGSGALRRWIENNYDAVTSCRTTSKAINDPDASAFIKRRAVWYKNIHCRGNKQIVDEENNEVDLPDEIIHYIGNLSPDVDGHDQIDDYKVHFKGFTDDHINDVQNRCQLPHTHPGYLSNYDDIYDEVLSEFIKRENGAQPASAGLAGSDENPIMYAVFHVPVEENEVDAQINEALQTMTFFKNFKI